MRSALRHAAWGAISILGWPSLAPACTWEAQLSADRSRLDLRCGAQRFAAPYTEPQQAGHGQPQVSADGRHVGWLALTTQCCNADPLPTALVIHDQLGVRQRFEMVPPAWAWQFSDDSETVRYRQSTTHGAHPETYTLRRIADGAVLDQRTCYPPDPDHGETAAILEPAGPIPAWMRSLLHAHHREDPQAALDAGQCP